ncbi:type II toxin-antitoxin system VapC family toxin [Rhodoplanes sp. TEM]|uniref:Ribonuclease VapC n=1 Tax=Rhodoplanes tepidamans TaxID=200616 RepID=A0ABT5JHP8_RHOTP|nr:MULTISPECIES: type II toxin-antitoxin system VapC family toxin [Rhodoplanes]MDC7788555.1 type II toxin-antitoxin system VapC family toxin [Rhodoplanes tepidamans]MDC7985154.1 type II toxin-antitoxin system VapC family toxin [Rhodoplanes sp. TEM]MDQ0353386.1 ribonuclease VapC [Rhodoplanes tepidamans]
MIIDTSALIAVLKKEPEEEEFLFAIGNAEVLRVSAATYFEAGLVVDRNNDPGLSGNLDELLEEAAVIIEPVTEAQAGLARQAYRDLGRGSGHPARLTFGDCFSYALAKAAGEPPLFKGDDFGRTDVAPALPPAG